jgi:peroxiredoxin
VRNDAKRYAEYGIVVVGVNGGSARSHDRFARWFRLNMRLLVDRGLQVSQLYDAVGRFGPFKFTERTVVGIDREGRIALYTHSLPSTDEVLASLDPRAQERGTTLA